MHQPFEMKWLGSVELGDSAFIKEPCLRLALKNCWTMIVIIETNLLHSVNLVFATYY